MNKRRRAILANLAPVVEFAMRSGAPGASERRDVPGLHMRARVNADDAAEILIYGSIGGWDGINAADVAAVLREAGPGRVNVRINSGGGDVFQGVAIHSLLARHSGVVTCYVDGVAASAASFIMLAGDLIVCARNAMIMIHDGMTMTYGNKATHDRAGELLDMVSTNIADMYAERAGEDVEHWRGLMTVNGEDGTWFTGVSAHESGLVDEITEPADDGPDEALVWDRVRTWADRMPADLRASIPPAEEPEIDKPSEDGGPDDAACLHDEDGAPQGVCTCTNEDTDDPDLPDDAVEAFAYSMSMWAYLNGHGHTARKVEA